MPTNDYTLEELRNSKYIYDKLKPIKLTLRVKAPKFESPIPSQQGGTSMNGFDDGDIFVGVYPTLARLPIGTSGQILEIDSTGTVKWTNTLTDALNDFNNNNLKNLYSGYKTILEGLTVDFADKDMQIFQIEQDITYVNTKNTEITTYINSNTNSINNYYLSLVSTNNDVSNIINKISIRYADLTTVNNYLTSVDLNLDQQILDIDNLNTDLMVLQNLISNVSSNFPNFTTYGNLILNGEFNIWNRSESFTGINTTGYITADHWYHSYGHGGTLTSMKETEIVNNKRTNIMKLSLTGATNDFDLITTIEDVRVIQNTSGTLSFYAKVDSPITINTEIIQQFGTSGSSPVSITVDYHNITNTWTKFSITILIPDITNKIVDYDGFIEIIFSLPNTFTNFRLAFVKFEEGSASTDFVSRPLALEENLCRRYFEQGYTTFNGRASANLGVALTHSYSITKYKIPNINVTLISNSGFLNTPTVGFMNEVSNGSIKVTKNTISGTGSFVALWQADSELIN